MYLLHSYTITYLFLNHAPAFRLSSKYIYLLRRDFRRTNFIQSFFNYVISCKIILSFRFCNCLLSLMSIVLTFIDDGFSMSSMETRFLWSDGLIRQKSFLFCRVSPSELFLSRRRACSFTKIWYFSFLFRINFQLHCLTSLKGSFGEFFLCEIKRILSQFLWEFEYFW